MKDMLFTPLEMGMLLQLVKDIETEQEDLIAKHEKLNEKLIKMVRLQNELSDVHNKHDESELFEINNKQIQRLKMQMNAFVQYKKELQKIVDKRIDEKIVDSDKNLRYKAFLYDWKI